MSRRLMLLVSDGGLGGIGSAVAALAAYLDRSNFAPTIVYLDLANQYLREKLHTCVGDGNLVVWRAWKSRFLRTVRELVLLARAAQIDIIHSHGAKADVMAALLGRSVSAPVVSTFHGTTQPCFRHYLYRSLQALSWRRCSRVIAVSRAGCNYVRGAGIDEDRIRLVHNGVDTSFFAPGGELPRDGRPVVGYIGRLSAEKGCDILLRAMASSAVRGKCSAEIVGEGRLERRFQRLALRLALDDVAFLGRLNDHREITRRWAACVVPSRSESFGLVAVEMMAQGVPVIAAAVGGLTEIITDRVSGILVRPRDHVALASAISEILEDRGLSTRISEAGRDEVCVRFCVARMVADTEAVYEEVLKTFTPADRTL